MQALLSVHEAVLAKFTQPLAGSQLSSVQTLPSSQLRTEPPWHLPPLQKSVVVQALPSWQPLPSALVVVQPMAGSHASMVQTSLSSQIMDVPRQTPPAQVSVWVHLLLSSHLAVLAVAVQPLAMSQLSSVQGFSSLQMTPAPGAHLPPAQVSPVVQALPSSQAELLSVVVQPTAGLQESLVQPLSSLHSMAMPGTHEPALQVSPSVHLEPSSHALVLSVAVQPWPKLQASSVHGLPSSHWVGLPDTQAPAVQVSPLVQGSLSSQPLVLLVFEQPTAMSQASSVQGLLSSQLTVEPTQLPAAQASFSVHLLPSSQTVPSTAAVWVHVVSGAVGLLALHRSTVQGLLSLQVLSSVLPLQSLSTPSQTSVGGSVGLQTGPQVLVPLLSMHFSDLQSVSWVQGHPSSPAQTVASAASATASPGVTLLSTASVSG